LSLSVLPAARLEAADAAVWYDDQRPGLGDEFLAELQQAVERVRVAPESFARLEGYCGRHDIRYCLLKRFPYLVIFSYRSEEIVIVAVSHVRRRPLYWLERVEA
jgi:plasmid stabilization system protein ParE